MSSVALFRKPVFRCCDNIATSVKRLSKISMYHILTVAAYSHKSRWGHFLMAAGEPRRGDGESEGECWANYLIASSQTVPITWFYRGIEPT